MEWPGVWKWAILVIALILPLTNSAKTSDSITLEAFNQSLSIGGQNYQFVLVPVFQVPLNLKRHKIFTTSQASLKRSINQQFPTFNDQIRKREVNGDATTLKVNHESQITFHRDDHSHKRFTEGIIGTTLCLHIPFLTTCDNSPDLTGVKNALIGQMAAIYEQLDSYQKTNNQRMQQLVQNLESQATSINSFAVAMQNITNSIGHLNGIVAFNLAMALHGDFIISAQVSTLNRNVDSLLRYFSAVCAVDPRQAMSQPSLSQLFNGYKAALQVVASSGGSPIVDQDNFTFQETVLPSQAVKNTVLVQAAFAPFGGVHRGWPTRLQYSCTRQCDWSAGGAPACCAFGLVSSGWIYGMFHTSHPGIYDVTEDQLGNPFDTPSIITVFPPNANPATNPSATLYCISFLGYKVLSTFNSTPYLMNGLIPGSDDVRPLEECNSLRLKTSPGTTIYQYYVLIDTLLVPFFSNCDRTSLSGLTPLAIQYSGNPVAAATLTGYDVNERHFVSSNCYINLEPDWIKMEYFIDSANITTNITDIPFGFTFEQFTVNPVGELSSSLAFSYTDEWAQVYSIKLVSQNTVIVDEIDALDGDLVLFKLSGTEVIDESDNFFGTGNNGRDCIRRSANYPYKLDTCLFQNHQTSYSTVQYLTGGAKTSGIARFTDKFFLAFNQTDNNGEKQYSFTLTPKPDVDFNFYVKLEGSICPNVLDSVASTDRCYLTLFYSGSNATAIGSPQDTIQYTNFVANLTVPFGTNTIYVESTPCLLVLCSFSLSTTTVTLASPNVKIISTDDANLNSVVEIYSTNYIQQLALDPTVFNAALNAIYLNISKAATQIANLDFESILVLNQYQNFTEARQRLLDRINGVNTNGGATYCPHPFYNFGCFLLEFAIMGIAFAVFFVGVGLLIALYRTVGAKF